MVTSVHKAARAYSTVLSLLSTASCYMVFMQAQAAICKKNSHLKGSTAQQVLKGMHKAPIHLDHPQMHDHNRDQRSVLAKTKCLNRTNVKKQKIISWLVNIPPLMTGVAPAGLVNPGPPSQSRVATWPTAAAQLRDAPGLPPTSNAPASPTSSGSVAPFSNKRRRLNSSDAGFGHATGNPAWETSQLTFRSAHLPAEQADKPASDTSNAAGMASDADSAPLTALAGAPQQRKADSTFTHAAPSFSINFSDEHMAMIAPDLLAAAEQLAPEPGNLSDAEHEPAFSNQSLVNDEATSDGSMPFRVMDYQLIDDKGKCCIGPSPLPEYDAEQESKLDHTSVGNWVWWRIDATWRFAKVGMHCCIDDNRCNLAL